MKRLRKSLSLVLAIGTLFALLSWQRPATASEELKDTNLNVEATTPIKPGGGDDWWLVYGFDSIWASLSTPNLLRINPADLSRITVDIPGLSGPIRRPVAGEGAIWVGDTTSDTVFKIDPTTNSLVGKFHVQMLTRDSMMAVGAGSLWTVTFENNERVLTRLNAITGGIEATIDLPSNSSGGAIFAGGSIWVMGTGGGEVYRIDPTMNAIVSTTRVHGSPSFAATDEKSIWVNNRSHGFVDRIDISSGKLISSIETGFVGPDDIVYAAGYVWLVTPSVALVQINPKTDTIARVYYHGKFSTGPTIAYGSDSLWLLSSSNVYRVTPPN